MRFVAALLLASCATLVALGAVADTPALRWSRPIQTGEGWSRIDLPDDVLAACRAGLPDLRIRSAAATEVPFVLEESLAAGTRQSWTMRDVESAPGLETTAIVDRGAHPPLAGEASIEVDAAEFLKPVVIESSDDARSWKEIARGSVFATSAAGGTARMTTLRFAPNDRRYWRFRLDDRNGAAVTPRSVSSDAIVPSAPAPRILSLDVKRASSEGGKTSYEATLPSANLAVTSLGFAPSDAVFARRVSVSERVLFRDELIRRVIGNATISRGPGGESLSVPLGELRGPSLEIEVDDGASPPLTLTKVTATVAPRSILFYAPEDSLPVSLEYGSPVFAPARYDLVEALARGRPDTVKQATLGAAIDRGPASPLGLPRRGGPLDESHWQTKAAIDLPSGGGTVAYLPLDGIDARGGIRVVDAASREVPFLFERAPHYARESVQPVVAESPRKTTLTLSNLAALHELDAIDLTASAPDYFRREVTVVETVRDARGPVSERALGSGTWERRPGEPAMPMRVSIATPTESTIRVELQNGDNPPLTLGKPMLERSVRRIDFLYAQGDVLFLLTGDPTAGSPTYDLALLAGALLTLPAQPAHLEPPRDLAPLHAPPPKWFWVAVILAGLGVGTALARTLGKARRV